MQERWRVLRRRRGVVVFACTALLSSVAFGMTITGAHGADALVAIAPRPIATNHTRATTTTTTTTTTTRARVAVAPVVPPPIDCAGIVATIRWPSGWRVLCRGPRAGLLGSTDRSGATTLFVRSGETMTRLRVVALHESGHAWDLARLDAPDIARWCRARGCDAARFFTGGVSVDQPGGAEDWAAAWDACHGGEYDRSYLGLPAPTVGQCALQDALVTYPA